MLKLPTISLALFLLLLHHLSFMYAKVSWMNRNHWLNLKSFFNQLKSSFKPESFRRRLNMNYLKNGTLVALLVISTLLMAMSDMRQHLILPTYFDYQEEVTPLYHFNSSKEMSKDELSEWDRIAYHLISTQDQQDNASLIYAYLYTAQRDAAYLSFSIKQRLEGSFNPISRKVLAVFFPHVSELQKDQDEDMYSNLLADIVMANVTDRIAKDSKQRRSYKKKLGAHDWQGEEPFIGLTTGSWKTWFINSGSQFRAPLPPPYNSVEWQHQLSLVKEACKKLTSYQEKAVLFWGGKGAESQSGDWRKIANDYMWNHHISLPMTLLVRSTLAMGIADASIAVFDSKYTYWIKRPSMLDKTVKMHLPLPNHPSYPSGHSTISSTAQTILSYFFPQTYSFWDHLAQEAGISRIWCGIHFPLDNEVGLALGKKIGQVAIQEVQYSIAEDKPISDEISLRSHVKK